MCDEIWNTNSTLKVCEMIFVAFFVCFSWARERTVWKTYRMKNEFFPVFPAWAYARLKCGLILPTDVSPFCFQLNQSMTASLFHHAIVYVCVQYECCRARRYRICSVCIRRHTFPYTCIYKKSSDCTKTFLFVIFASFSLLFKFCTTEQVVQS